MNNSKKKVPGMVIWYGSLLASRIILLGLCVAMLFIKPEALNFRANFGFGKGLTFVNGVWIFLVCNLLPQAFSKPLGSMGFRKQFGFNYMPRQVELPSASEKNWEMTPKAKAEKKFLDKGALRVAIIYGALIAAICILYVCKVIGDKAMLIIAAFFYVCDLICVLGYCPFQHLMMKNKCCRTCRIFNWDAIMTYGHFIVCPSWFTYSLLAFAIMLLTKWEIHYHRYPQRFLQTSNCAMDCRECNEHFCYYKAFAKNVKTTFKIECGGEPDYKYDLLK